ncbi:hypothetical protein MNBD_GAMMA10-537, partial [hydrothermal vent metagenome]
MKLSKKKARIVKSAISEWAEDKVITQEQSGTLLNSYEITHFDWKRVARYSFWLAIFCIIISVSAALADEW